MLNGKEEYFKLSQERAVPNRCPLLARCERRAQSLALGKGWPLKNAWHHAGLASPVISIISEGPSKAGGLNNFALSRQCPEVNLFEPTDVHRGFARAPMINGEYDKYWDEPYQIRETGHFSECAEFAQHVTEQRDQEQTKRSWLRLNYQWVIGTLIALGGTIAGFLASK